LERSPDRWAKIYIHSNGLTVAKVHIPTVDEQHGGWTSGEISEANARLIAAAPELLEAVKALTSKLLALESSPEFTSVFHLAAIHGQPYEGDTYVRELEAAVAAIAKAEGK
jgi:hypothetical protein